MERKEQALVKALSALEALELSISGNNIDSSQVLAVKLNDFVSTLGTIFEESRSMNESSLFPVPLDLFEHVSQPSGNNPDLYQMKLLEEADQTGRRIKQKISHLQDVSDAVEAGINPPPDDLPPPPPPPSP